MSKKLKPIYWTKTKKHLVSLKEGIDVYTSLAYRQDYRRRALGELKQHGYFKQLSRFHYQRTNKIL